MIFTKSDPLPLKLLKVILALCLATPLLAFSGVIFPYTVPKVFAFRVLVEIAAVFYLYLILKYPASFCVKKICHPERLVPRSLSEVGSEGSKKDSSSADWRTQNDKKGSWPARHASWFTSVAGAVGFFLLINFISALFGADLYFSFWGNLERGMGVFGLLHFAAFFFMLVSVFRSREELIGLIKISVFTSALISLLAIFQHFFSLSDLLPQVDRVYSLIGNAGVFASYLIFNIFLAAYLAISSLQKGTTSQGNLPVRHASWLTSVAGAVILRERSNRRIYFYLYSLFIILNSFALLLSGTRGAWLGLLAGVTIFLAIMAWQSQQKKWRKIAIWSLAIIFILGTSLFIIRDSSFAKNNPALYRLSSISLNDSTAQSRLILWQGAWQAWQSKPILGFGPENFETAIGKYVSPRLAEFEGYSTDRAHNFIFDYGVTLGWLGLLSYLSIFVVALWQLIKNLKNNLIFSAIFISLLAAYLVQNLFIFDSFVSYLMSFFVLACISNFAHSDCTKLSDKQPEKEFFSKPLGIIKKLILILVIGNLSFVIYAYNLKPFLVANYASQILSLPANEATQVTLLLKNVILLNSFALPEITYQVTLDYIDKISQNPALAQNEEFYNVASTELSKIIAHSPNQFKNYIALSWLNLYFSGQDKTRIDQSLQLAQKVRELSPNKKDAYLLLVAGYSLSGQPQKALQVVDQAIAIDAKMGEEVKAYFERLK